MSHQINITRSSEREGSDGGGCCAGGALGKDVTPGRNREDGSAHVCAKIRSKTGACAGKRTAWPGRSQAEFNLFSLAKPERGSRMESRLLPAGRPNRRNPNPRGMQS